MLIDAGNSHVRRDMVIQIVDISAKKRTLDISWRLMQELE